MAASFVVVSTGRSRDVYRSIEARLTREMTTMWLYFSNYGMTDPLDYEIYNLDGAYPEEGILTSEACGGGWSVGSDLPYMWQSPPMDPDSTKPPKRYSSHGVQVPCVEGFWYPTFTFNGPIHSNDTFFAFGGHINGQFSSSDPACRQSDPEDPASWDWCVQPGGYADWMGPAPQYREVLQLPAVGAAREKSLDGVGCLYQGPTRIILEGSQMTVWSKETTTQRDDCGTLAELRSAAGATVDVPIDSMIFVDAAEGVAPKKIKAGAIGGEPGRELPLGSYTGAAPSPGAQYIEEVAMSYKDKADGIGNLWLEGHMTGGHLTIATDRTAVLTGDLLTDDDEHDLLGVMAGDAIEVHNPVMQTVGADESGTAWLDPVKPLPRVASYRDQWPTDYNGNRDVFKIESALHVVTAGLRVQNHNMYEDLGLLDIYGSLTENFPALQGTVGGGYEMVLNYNKNLREGPPLLFPPVVNGQWVIANQAKATPAEEIKEPPRP
jgi:hypothetical protein